MTNNRSYTLIVKVDGRQVDTLLFHNIVELRIARNNLRDNGVYDTRTSQFVTPSFEILVTSKISN